MEPIEVKRVPKVYPQTGFQLADRSFRARQAVPGVFIVADEGAAAKAADRLKELGTIPVAWHATYTDIDETKYTSFDKGKLVSLTGHVLDGNDAEVLFIDCWKDGDLLLHMKAYFESAFQPKVFHDFDSVFHQLHRQGIELRGLLSNTRYLTRLLNSSLASWEGQETKLQCKDYQSEEEEEIDLGYNLLSVAKHYNIPVPLEEPMPKDKAAAHCDQRYFASFVRQCAFEARIIGKLYETLTDKLKEEEWTSEVLQKNRSDRLNLFDYSREVVRPLSEFLVEIERRGFAIDQPLLHKMKQDAETVLKTHLSQFIALSKSLIDPITKLPLNPGAEFINPRSTTMMRHYLFGSGVRKPERTQVFKTELSSYINLTCLDLTPLGDKKTKFYTHSGHAKVGSAVLLAFSGKNPVTAEQYGAAYDQLKPSMGEAHAITVSRLLWHASKAIKASSLLSGVLEATVDRLTPHDGRLHASLSLDTSTGRLVSRKPNLQNPPSNDLRHIFTASEGKTLIVADYSQLELRILAHISNCQSMINNLNSGADYHSMTAVEMFPQIAEKLQSKELASVHEIKTKYALERSQAKTLNFSIVYGKSVKSLAEDLKLSERDATALLDAWFNTKQEVKTWKQEVIEAAHWTNASYSILGRPRVFPHIQSPRLRKRSERAAVNHGIQGSAADIAVAAMLRVRGDPTLKRLDFNMVLQVHDEFILEGPEEHAAAALQRVKELMENPFTCFNPHFKFKVPMLVEAGIAKTWAQAKP